MRNPRFPRFLTLLPILCALCFLAGCGAKKESAPSPEPAHGARASKEIAEELDDIATIEQAPAMEGRVMSMLMSPNPKKIAKYKADLAARNIVEEPYDEEEDIEDDEDFDEDEEE